MSHFPELPKLPDPAEPLKQIAQGIREFSNGIQALDAARQEAADAFKTGREALQKSLKRPAGL